LPTSYYVLAHSTGANVALLSAERISSQVERMVLTAPLVALPQASPQTLARTTGFLMHFGLGEMLLPVRAASAPQAQPFENNPVTTDPNRFARARAVLEAEPSLGIGGATIGWLNAAMRASGRILEPDFSESVNVPVLIVLSGSEEVVSNQAAEALSRRLKMAAHLRIPGARHEVLMESNVFRDQFWVAFDAFIKGRT
jgi:lysophospholipase